MHPSSSTSSTSMPLGNKTMSKEKWSKQTYDKRMEVLVATIRILIYRIGVYEETINDLKRHLHDSTSGLPHTLKPISDNYYGQNVPPRASPLSNLPIDNFDFDELTII